MTRRGRKKTIVQMGNQGSVTNKTHFPREKENQKSLEICKRKNPKKI